MHRPTTRSLVALVLFFAASTLRAVPVHDWSKSFAFHSLPQTSAIATDGAANVLVAGAFHGNLDFGGGPLTSVGGQDIFLVKFDAAGNHLWSRAYGSSGFETCQSVTADDMGNVLITGRFQGSMDLGGGPLTSAGGEDIFVAKYDADGDHLWSRRFGELSTQHGIAVATDAAGNVAITGWFTGTLDFGGLPLASVGQIDGYVAKLDADGNHLWSRRYGDAAFQRSRALAFDELGNLIVTGDYDGSVDFGDGPLTSAGGVDIFLVKFDPDGVLLWNRQFGALGNDTVAELAVDGTGNIVLAGDFELDVDFGGGVLTSAGAADAFVAVFDADGNHAWSRRFGSASNQYPTSVALDESDNIVLTGYFWESIDFGGGVLTSEGNYELFIASLDAAGNHVFSRRFAKVGFGEYPSLATDADGNVLLTAGFNQPIDIGGGPFSPDQNGDSFVARFDEAGDHVWSFELGLSNGSGYGLDLAVDGAHNLVLAGACAGSVDFGDGLLAGPFVDNAVLAKFDADGNHLWSHRFEGAGVQYASSVATDTGENIIVGGIFNGTVDFGGSTLTSLGSDIFLAKFDAQGNHLWSRRFGDADPQSLSAIATTAAGITYLTGWMMGSLDFGGNVLTAVGGGWNVYVASFDAAGNHRWSRSFGGAMGLAVDADDAGNVVITGTMQGDVDFGGGLFTAAGGDDIFLASFDADGDYRWSRRFGDAQEQRPMALSIDGAGNVVVTGRFQGSVNFGGGALTNAAGSDIFVVSFSSSASHRWSRRFGSTAYEQAAAVHADDSGNVFFTGVMQTAVDFGGGPLTGPGLYGIFLTALDSAGDYLWSERYDGWTDLEPAAVVTDSSGDIALAGYTGSYVDFGGGRLGGSIFLAHFGDEQVPVRFASFEATLRQRAVQVQWDVRTDGAEEMFTLYRRDALQAPAVALTSGNLRAADPSYLDASVLPGKTYYYQLVITTRDGEAVESSVVTVSIPARRATLAQNAPNPFNPKTVIEYTLGERSTPALYIYDATGRLVARLDQGLREAGAHRIEWDGTDGSGHALASGVYYYSLAGVRGLPSKKMLLLR